MNCLDGKKRQDYFVFARVGSTTFDNKKVRKRSPGKRDSLFWIGLKNFQGNSYLPAILMLKQRLLQEGTTQIGRLHR